MTDIIIIGGGVGGCGAALELANAGHKVILIEMRDQLLSGSSDDTPCRLGLGFHYIDEETAELYLKSTIKLLKKYPNFVVAGDKDTNHPFRRGRYFVAKDSQFSLAKITKLHETLKEKYTRLVKEDSSNQVVGDPEKFSTVIPISEYEHIVNKEKVIMGFETAEQTLDWPRFKMHLIGLLSSHPNITIYKNTKVTTVQRHDDGNFQIYAISQPFLDKTLESKQSNLTFSARYLVNASWYNIGSINATAGIHMQPKDKVTNRTKVMTQVQLPYAFSEKEINSMFFCFGPFCSITNIGDGKAFLSYEPVTNIEQSTDLEVSEKSKRLLEGKATDQEKEDYATKIIEGVAQFVPGVKGATIIDVRFGNVRTKGEVNINSPQSAVHKRNDLGVEVQQMGWVDFPCMKLLYFDEGALKVKQIFDLHLQADAILDDLYKQTRAANTTPFSLKEAREKVDAAALVRANERHGMVSKTLSPFIPQNSLNNLILEFADEGLHDIQFLKPYMQFLKPFFNPTNTVKLQDHSGTLRNLSLFSGPRDKKDEQPQKTASPTSKL